ncbi:phage C1 repressor [Alkalidesulfovibrio alkalitolerans DSM 16529]|uniref:Phage C1 repressor n=1 Tax=Alkalidesulfovibrio alkalitolerans DSM 16529 TaxID=1121439 RepID=S7TEY0_9BACT|nr:S24 family peptidase [Alkalidesulfovibrio alkalitolerans]EPR35160.1 phage C1 repressor [Alkalidesulfovibrio alkalitolerans DSM 16529]
MKGLFLEDILGRMMHVSGSRNQAELANVLGVKRAAVTDAKRRGAVPSDWYMRLTRLYGANPVWLETGLGEERLGQADGGLGGEWALVPATGSEPKIGRDGRLLASEEAEGQAFKRSWLASLGVRDSDDLCLMPMLGPAMAPGLLPGDALLVDQGRREASAGAVMVCAVDGAALVRRIERRPGKILLAANDPHVAAMELPASAPVTGALRLVGRVIWASRVLA